MPIIYNFQDPKSEYQINNISLKHLKYKILIFILSKHINNKILNRIQINSKNCFLIKIKNQEIQTVKIFNFIPRNTQSNPN